VKAVYIQGRCVREWSAFAQCEACATECPVGAVKLTKTPLVDDRCTGCGICMRVCPTEALVASEPYSEIAKRVPIVDGVALVRCGFEVNCIGHVDESLLYHALGRGAKAVKVVHCGKCPRGVDVEKERGRILRLGLPVEFEEASHAPVPGEVRRGEKPLDLIKRYVEVKEIIKREGVLLVRGVPEKRALLNASNQPPSLYVMKIVDPQQCDYLGVCAAVCPTGALRWDGKGALKYTPALCVKCKNCITACNAIKNAEAPPENPHAEVTLVSFKLVKCKECGALYPYKGEDICPSCKRAEEELQSWFGKGARTKRFV